MADHDATPTGPASVLVRLTAWQAAVGGALVLWSLTYLGRQTLPVSGGVPSPLGDFALEGAALALAWLGAVLAVCFGACLELEESARGGRTTALTPGRRAAGGPRATRPIGEPQRLRLQALLAGGIPLADPYRGSRRPPMIVRTPVVPPSSGR
jgi:hypothetical protein